MNMNMQRRLKGPIGLEGDKVEVNSIKGLPKFLKSSTTSYKMLIAHMDTQERETRALCESLDHLSLDGPKGP